MVQSECESEGVMKTNETAAIELDRLRAHPDNPNEMSKADFAKLTANIKRTGLYEPVIVRPSGSEKECFELINGHHRCKALKLLGEETVNCVVWDVGDEDVDIFLSTLNRLGGKDDISKKAKLLKRLSERLGSREISKLLPMSKTAIEKLCDFSLPDEPVRIEPGKMLSCISFFLNAGQKSVVDLALKTATKEKLPKAAGQAIGLTVIAKFYMENFSERTHGNDES